MAKPKGKKKAVREFTSGDVSETPAEHRNQVTKDDIARRAYELFLARGCGDGHDLADWFEAERQLRAHNVAGK